MSSTNEINDEKLLNNTIESSSSLDADQNKQDESKNLYKLFLQLAIKKLISLSFSFKFLFLLIILNVVLFHLEKLIINTILVIAFAIG
jgi:hypothetical protein